MFKTYSSAPSQERISNIECSLCGSSDRSLYWDCGDYTFFRCNNCKLIYQYPQPVQKDLSLRYDSNYFDYEINNEKVFFNLMLKTLSDIDFDSLSSKFNIAESEFLDVGCATGLLPEYMKNKGWVSRGVELCEASASYGKKVRKVDIYNGTLEEAGYSDNQFSIVHSSHLIEHLTSPSGYVEEVYRILKPGGYFITTTPNAASFQAIMFGKNWRSAIADHMFLFSVSTLSAMIKKQGFSITKTGTWGGIAAGLVPGIIKRPIDYLAKKIGFGDVMVVLARKT